MGKEQEAGTAKAAPTWQRYSIITLRSDQGVKVGGRDVVQFVDVDARITPLGMQVRVTDKGYAPLVDGDGKVTTHLRNHPIAGSDLLIDVPAWKITQAERVADGRP